MEAPKGKSTGKGVAPPPPPKGKGKGVVPLPRPVRSKPPTQAAPAAKIKLKAHNAASTKIPVEHSSPSGHAERSEPVPLADDLSTSERAREILSKEPVIEKVHSSSASCSGPDFDSVARCNAAHGTTLAAVLSALRNTNGQMVSINRMEELGSLWASGATPETYLVGKSNPLRHTVFAADLQLGQKAFETAEKYAYGEIGIREKADGRKVIRRSEAACIPVVVVGCLVDPQGVGANLNVFFLNPSEQQVASYPEGHPLYGKSVEDVKNIFAGQIIGEWIDVHMIFAAHPTDPAKDTDVVDLVKDLVMRAAAEQGRDYSGIRVGSLRKEVVVFKEATAKSGATNEDVQRYLYEATPPLSQKL